MVSKKLRRGRMGRRRLTRGGASKKSPRVRTGRRRLTRCNGRSYQVVSKESRRGRMGRRRLTRCGGCPLLKIEPPHDKFRVMFIVRRELAKLTTSLNNISFKPELYTESVKIINSNGTLKYPDVKTVIEQADKLMMDVMTVIEKADNLMTSRPFRDIDVNKKQILYNQLYANLFYARIELFLNLYVLIHHINKLQQNMSRIRLIFKVDMYLKINSCYMLLQTQLTKFIQSIRTNSIRSNTDTRSQYEKLLSTLKPATLTLDNCEENDWMNFQFTGSPYALPGDKSYNIENQRFSIRGVLLRYNIYDVNWQQLSLPDGKTVLNAIDSNSDTSLFDTGDLHSMRDISNKMREIVNKYKTINTSLKNIEENKITV